MLDGLISDPDVLREVACAATGLDDGEVTVVESDLSPVLLTNMTTTALGRVRGTIAGTSWSAVVKVLQPPDRSAIWNLIPPAFHAQVLADLPWRSEPALYRSEFHIPAHGRLPAVYRIDDIDEAHTAIWMEDVAHRPGAWTDDDYRRAGRLLGTMWAHGEPGFELERKHLRGYFFGRVTNDVLPALKDDATWAHPVIAAAADADLRADLLALADRAPAILDALDAFPSGMTHGDACPQNLLRSPDSDDFIVIDWQFVSLGSVGFDPGQTLAGYAENGELAPDRLPAVFDAVLSGYVEGVGSEFSAADIRSGMAGALVIRSAFTAVPVELLGEPAGDARDRLIADRMRYARFLVDLASTI